MQIINPNTNQVFTDSADLANSYCAGRECDTCPFASVPDSCINFITRYPHYSAKIMGYKNISPTPSPLCQILSVEPDEPWTYKGVQYRISADSAIYSLINHDWKLLTDATLLIDMIQHVNDIQTISSPWTQSEINEARALYNLLGNCSIERSQSNNLYLHFYNAAKEKDNLQLSVTSFPTLLVGCEVDVQTIIQAQTDQSANPWYDKTESLPPLDTPVLGFFANNHGNYYAVISRINNTEWKFPFDNSYVYEPDLICWQEITAPEKEF